MKPIFISALEPVGNYAIRISFSDGHDPGLFSWDILYDYGQRQQELLADYLERLAATGGSRY